MTATEKKRLQECQALADRLNGLNLFYGDRIMKLHAGVYLLHKNLVLTLFDPEEGPFSNITVNIEELPLLEFAVDTNNFPQATTVLHENKLAEPTEKVLRSGFCIYPVWKLTLDKFFYKED